MSLAVGDGTYLEPAEGLGWLVVRAGVVAFWDVVKGVLAGSVGVEVGVKGEFREGALGRNDQRCKKMGERGAGQEELKDLRGVVVHEGVVHEHGGS